MREVTNGLKRLGKIRTSETYTSTLNSFMRFMEGRDIPPCDMDSDLMIAYEAWLKSGGVSMNTISFTCATCGRYITVPWRKNSLSSVSLQTCLYGSRENDEAGRSPACDKTAHDIGPVTSSGQEVCKGHAASQFYTRGMSMIDMVFLKRRISTTASSHTGGKNRSTTFVKWEPCMQEIVDRYNIPGSPYLLPIIARPGMDERKQYINASHRINRYLKAIGKELGLSVPLTHYVARHSWASAARSKNIPISVISEGMGHDSENTTRIYLTTLDTATIDKANRLILNSLCRE